MNEVVKMVSQKTGLDEAKSQQAVEAVMSFLRDKLPAPVASQIDNVMNGDGASKRGGMGGVAKSIGGMMGGAKNKG